MVGKGQACDQDGPGQMPETCQKKRIEALGGVSAEKVADAPAADGPEGVEP